MARTRRQQRLRALSQRARKTLLSATETQGARVRCERTRSLALTWYWLRPHLLHWCEFPPLVLRIHTRREPCRLARRPSLQASGACACASGAKRRVWPDPTCMCTEREAHFTCHVAVPDPSRRVRVRLLAWHTCCSSMHSNGSVRGSCWSVCTHQVMWESSSACDSRPPCPPARRARLLQPLPMHVCKQTWTCTARTRGE